MTRARLLVLVGFLPCAACAWWMAGRPNATAIDQLIFSHAFHLEQDIECSSCHGEIATSDTIGAATSSAQDVDLRPFLPREATCLECHEREDKCGMCHRDPEAPRTPTRRAPDLRFSHRAHQERAQDCFVCHEAIKTAAQLPADRPSMDTCLGCHNHASDYAEARCLDCHPRLDRLPLRAVAELDHGGDWMGRHGLAAKSNGAQCLTCHAQTRCADCHSRVPAGTTARLFPEQVERTLLHRGDWISSHAIEARAEGDTCVRCHATSDCTTCHREHGLTPNASFGTEPPHPSGYTTRGGAAFHGEDARRHIETCAACHDQGPDSNCVKCHYVGAVGGNPHPPGWGNRFDPDAVRKNEMCRYCHVQ